jgi:hypothetical protein
MILSSSESAPRRGISIEVIGSDSVAAQRSIRRRSADHPSTAGGNLAR